MTDIQPQVLRPDQAATYVGLTTQRLARLRCEGGDPFSPTPADRFCIALQTSRLG